MPAPFNAVLPKYQRLAAGPINGTSGGVARLGFTRFDPGCTTDLYDSTAGKAVGTRTHLTGGMVRNVRRAAPQVSLQPTPLEWASVLPWIMHSPTAAAVTGATTVPLGERECSRDLAFDDTQRVWTVTDCVVGSATFSASAGGPLSLDLSCAGTDFTTALTFPTGTTIPLGPPFMMVDASISLAGVTSLQVQSVTWTIDHGLSTDRYFQGSASSGAIATDRNITVSLTLPYGVHGNLWNAGAGDAGAVVNLTFVRGTSTLAISFPAVRATEPSVGSTVPSEVFLPWSGRASSNTPGGEMTATITV